MFFICLKYYIYNTVLIKKEIKNYWNKKIILGNYSSIYIIYGGNKMKNRKRLMMFLCVILMLSVILSSCNNNKDKNLNNGKPEGNNGTAQGNNETLGKYNQQGRIVKIDEKGIEVQVADKVERYNVAKEKADKYYVGEYVGLNALDNNNYDIFADESYNYNNRLTLTGDPIKRITGTVGEVKDDFVTAVTEMGDVKLANNGDFNLKSGSQAMFDYVEMPGGNQIVSFYDEASKINVMVKEVSRDTSGIMRIYALAADKKEYDIQVDADTITNFAHSTLAVDDEITVYPKNITGDVPAVVDAKLIVKNKDK